MRRNIRSPSNSNSSSANMITTTKSQETCLTQHWNTIWLWSLPADLVQSSNQRLWPRRVNLQRVKLTREAKQQNKIRAGYFDTQLTYYLSRSTTRTSSFTPSNAKILGCRSIVPQHTAKCLIEREVTLSPTSLVRQLDSCERDPSHDATVWLE